MACRTISLPFCRVVLFYPWFSAYPADCSIHIAYLWSSAFTPLYLPFWILFNTVVPVIIAILSLLWYSYNTPFTYSQSLCCPSFWCLYRSVSLSGCCSLCALLWDQVLHYFAEPSHLLFPALQSFTLRRVEKCVFGGMGKRPWGELDFNST